MSPRAGLEAILAVADEPVPEAELAALLGLTVGEASALAVSLREDYLASGRGFELRRAATGWRLYSHPGCADVVERYLGEGRHARLTQAALETLAIVAYRQPVTRARVAAVRGVNVDAVVRTLVSRGLVMEVGVEAGSGASLYGTTETFLDRLGIGDLRELPDIAGLVPHPETLEADHA